ERIPFLLEAVFEVALALMDVAEGAEHGAPGTVNAWVAPFLVVFGVVPDLVPARAAGARVTHARPVDTVRLGAVVTAPGQHGAGSGTPGFHQEVSLHGIDGEVLALLRLMRQRGLDAQPIAGCPHAFQE